MACAAGSFHAVCGVARRRTSGKGWNCVHFPSIADKSLVNVPSCVQRTSVTATVTCLFCRAIPVIAEPAPQSPPWSMLYIVPAQPLPAGLNFTIMRSGPSVPCQSPARSCACSGAARINPRRAKPSVLTVTPTILTRPRPSRYSCGMSVAAHLGIALDEYDARIRTFIPDYDEMIAAGAASVPTRSRVIVDLGVGTGALAARCLTSAPRASIVGIDADSSILELASRRLGRRARLLTGSFLSVDFPRCDAIVE